MPLCGKDDAALLLWPDAQDQSVFVVAISLLLALVSFCLLHILCDFCGLHIKDGRMGSFRRGQAVFGTWCAEYGQQCCIRRMVCRKSVFGI
uniref:Uncharacterized protein n=1 Tax=Arundo donax TaxID=35708 RepID=A0A0A8Z8P5_ARUDO